MQDTCVNQLSHHQLQWAISEIRGTFQHLFLEESARWVTFALWGQSHPQYAQTELFVQSTVQHLRVIAETALRALSVLLLIQADSRALEGTIVKEEEPLSSHAHLAFTIQLLPDLQLNIV
jgi:hypothetical protein